MRRLSGDQELPPPRSPMIEGVGDLALNENRALDWTRLLDSGSVTLNRGAARPLPGSNSMHPTLLEAVPS